MSRRLGAGTLARLAGALALLAGAAFVPASTAAGQAEAPPAPPVLADQTPWLVGDGPLDLGFRTGGDLPDGSTVELTLYGAVVDRAALGTADPALLGPVRDVLSVPAEIVPTDDGVHRLRLATDGSGGGGLPLADPGVYPLAVAVRPPGGEPGPALVTYVVRPDDGLGPAPLLASVVVPLHAPPAHGLDGTPTVTRRTERLLEERSRVLRDHEDVAVTVVPTPETLEAVAATDPDLADLVRRALARRHVVAGPYVRLDLGGWAAVPALADDLQAQFGSGERTLEGLLARPVDRRTWIGVGNPTPAALDALAAAGRERAVFPLETVAGIDRPVDEPVVVTGTTGQALDAVLVDPALRGQRPDTDDPVLIAQRTLADLALQSAAAGVAGAEAGVVVSLPAVRPLAPALLDTLLAGLGAPGAPVRPVGLDELFAADPAGVNPAEPGPTVLGVAQPGSSLAGYAVALEAASGPVAGYASFAGRQDELSVDLHRRLQISGAAELVDLERLAYLRSVSEDLQARTALVDVVDAGSVTLTSREGDIPVTVTNETGGPVEVLLGFDSDNRLDFPEGAQKRIALAPGANRIDVPVVARASGAFPLRITATSPDGRLVVDRARLTVRSTAVSGVGIVLSVGAGLVLVVWWARHWHTTRRNRRLVARDDGGNQAAGPPV